MATSTRQSTKKGVRPDKRRDALGKPLTSSSSVPTADDVPVTRAMLMAVRDELGHRIDQTNGRIDAVRDELRGEIREVRDELDHRINAVRDELRAEIREVRDELRAEIREVRDELREVKQGLHALQDDVAGIKADMARIVLLVEEQNARNRVVLDGLMAVVDRQNRVEKRVDAVEAAVLDLAASRDRGLET